MLEYLKIKENEIHNYDNVTGAFAIVNVNGLYLIGFNSWRKQWEFPAGGIEKGETAREAAERELFEETHQKNNDLAFRGLFKVMKPDGEIKYQAIFLCFQDEIEPFVKGDEDEVNYDKYRPTYQSELYEDILNYSRVCEDSSLLEIGIGTGQATLPFLQFGAEVTAVELGDKLSAYVKEKYKEYLRFKVLNADFSSINIEENSLNLVYSATAFHWLPVPESYQKIKNSLKSGGVIALFWNHPFPNRDDDPSNTASRAIYQKYRPSDKKPREFSEQDCRKYVDALVENGFESEMRKAINDAGGYINIYDTIDLYLGRKR